MTTLFISDLHLSTQRPAIIELFERFLSERARHADALYILGDLFEYWIGDDAMGHAEFARIVDALDAFGRSGTPLWIMRGNRDFLLGGDFSRRTGARVLSGPLKLDLYGTEAVVTHGDCLCTRDVEHQAWRSQVLQDDWQKEFLAMPLQQRMSIAKDLRQRSESAKSGKSMDLMDVTDEAVKDMMRAHRVGLLIHGHTHRPGEHDFLLDERPARRVVLGDWYEQGSVLECGPGGCVLQEIPVDGIS